MKRQIIKGQSVMIYHDPFSQTREEGAAICLRKLREDHPMLKPRCETWRVKFISDKSTATRDILVED